MPALVILFIIIIGGIAYGFVDAYKEKLVEADIRASLVSPWGLYFDTMKELSPIDHGRVLVQITWPLIEGKLVSSIHAKGTITDGDEPVTEFDGLCQRGASTWLGDGKWPYDGKINTDRVCFVMTDKITKATAADGTLFMDEANARVATMQLSYEADVRAVNKPMRYVTWLSEQAKSLAAAVRAPFEREQ